MAEERRKKWRPSPEQRAELLRQMAADKKFTKRLQRDGFTVEECAEALERAFVDELWPGGTLEEYFEHLSDGIARELQKIRAARGRIK